MPLPEIVQGSLLDVRRLLAFKLGLTVDNLVFFNEKGIEIHRIDHFWLLEPPRIKFGNAYESCRLVIVEDEELVSPMLDAHMKLTTAFRYEVVDEANVTTMSPAFEHYGIRAPQFGRNRAWKIELHAEAFSQNYFTPPAGQ